MGGSREGCGIIERKRNSKEIVFMKRKGRGRDPNRRGKSEE
jgi:hypothetical protein